MATQFLYQPHIHGEGMVLTPDLPLSRVLAFTGEDGPFWLSVKRLVTDQVVQCAAEAPKVLPAFALVAASEGPLVVPAAFIVEPLGDQSSISGGEIALSRQACRLKDCDPDAIRPAIGEAAGATAGVEAAIREADDLSYGTIVILAAADGPPARSQRYEVSLPTGGQTLTHGFAIERLV